MSFTLLASAAGRSTDDINATTDAAINTTGANLIVLLVSSYANETVPRIPSDNMGNDWQTQAIQFPSTYPDGFPHVNADRIQGWYWFNPASPPHPNPIVGAGHTFSVNTFNSRHAFPAIAVAAYSVTNPGYDQLVGYPPSTISAVTTIQPGALLPANDGELLIAALAFDGNLGGDPVPTVNSSYSVLQNRQATVTSCGIALAHQIQTTATSRNPTWTVTNAYRMGTLQIAFSGSSTPPPAPLGSGMRALRRFPLPFNHHLLTFLWRLEIVAQMGVGLNNGQGSDPQIMLRLSKDGGSTWGHESWRSAGQIGQYLRRAYWTSKGQARHWVAEITVSDPVFWALIDCVVDTQAGTS